MDLVNERFVPALPWVTGPLQTIADRVTRPHHRLDDVSRQDRRQVGLPDGDVLVVRLHEPLAAPADRRLRPVVLLVHGLGGTADSTYVRASARGLLRAGFPVARVDLRGAGESAALSRGLYHGGRTEDLRAVLAILAGLPLARGGLAVMGFSLGGNAVLKLLGEPLGGLPVRGGVAVSAPVDLQRGVEHIHRATAGLYERAMMWRLRLDATHPGVDLSDEERLRIRRTATLVDFDSLVTAPRNGWRDAAEYYAINSCGPFLPAIRVPTLVIHAADDPMIPVQSYLEIDWEGLARAGAVRRAITAGGGHVGFHAQGSPLPWYVGRAIAHLDTHVARPAPLDEATPAQGRRSTPRVAGHRAAGPQ